MRRRLMVAMVGLVAVTLVVAGAGGLLLTRKAAHDQATSQLVSEADSLTSGRLGVQSKADLRVIRMTLKLSDAAFVRIDAAGRVRSKLPDGITAADLDVPALQDGSTVSGNVGNRVYAVAPAQLTLQERGHLRFKGTIAILLTRDVGDLGPSWVYFIVAGAVGLAVAALVAWHR